MHKFCEKKLQNFCKQPVKRNLHIFSFSWLKIGLFKNLPKKIEMAWSRAFQKCIIFHFLDKNFYFRTGFCDKKIFFANLQYFFADFKSRAQALFNDLYMSYLDMGFRGGRGVKLTPSQHILVCKYPSRDRVNLILIQYPSV